MDSQVIEPTDIGFTKHYYLDDGKNRVVDQTIQYRTYNFANARSLMASYGFEYRPTDSVNRLFLQFEKVT